MILFYIRGINDVVGSAITGKEEIFMAKTILIVDDALFMRKMLKDILTQAGYEIVGEGEDGDDGYKKYKELKPNLVTMDITMPNTSGLDGAKKIINEFPDANILMCSAMGQQNMVVESVTVGAKGFIVKPFKADKVIDAVQKLIGTP